MSQLPEKLLTPGDLAKMFSVTIPTITSWYKQGVIPKPTIANYRTLRWHPDQIEKFLRQR